MKRLGGFFILLWAVAALGTVTITTTKTGKLDADGTTTEFSFSFPYEATSEVKVDVITDAADVATRQEETTHYSVSPSSSTSGGTVTFEEAPDDGNYIVISRTTAVTQDADIDAGAYTSRTAIEDALDEIYRILNELTDAIKRSMRVPQSEDADLELDGALTRASSYLYFGADGTLTTTSSVASDNTVISSFMETVVDDDSGEAALTTMGGIHVYNVTSPPYNADPTGVTDSTTAIQAAIDAAELVKGKVFIPIGTFKFTELTVEGNIEIAGANREGSILKKYGNYVGITATHASYFHSFTLDSDGGADASDGIQITGASGGRWRMNNVTIFNQGAIGLYISTSNMGVFSALRVNGNGADGIKLDGVHDAPSVNHNSFVGINCGGNGEWGFNLNNGRANVLSRMSCTYNTSGGFRLYYGSFRIKYRRFGS